jgi:signal peptidase I
MPVLFDAYESHKLEMAAEVLASGGSIRLQALGTSMLPSIWPGDVLSIEHKLSHEIVAGDIVLVARQNRFFVHRVIEKNNVGWITRGDSVPQNDEPVAAVQVLGRVTLIHRKTKAIVPDSRVSAFRRTFAWTVCRWDLFRNIILRIHSFWQGRVGERSKPNAERLGLSA